MKRPLVYCLLSIVCFSSVAQKKPLDHSVYDSWQHIGERMISNDGKWVVYTIDPQEGDNELVIQSSDAQYKKTVPRGYQALITEDSRFVIFKIKPLYKDTREARIKKKKTEDFPKDSFAIVELGKENIWKTAKVKAYKTPQKTAGWVGYHLEKITETPARTTRPSDNSNKRVTDSLNRIIDSLNRVIETMPKQKRKKNKDGDETESFEELITSEEDQSLHASRLTPDGSALDFAEGDDPPTPTDAGSDLILRKLETGEEKTFNNVLEYFFSKTGDKLLIEQAKNPKDSLSKPVVIFYDLKSGNTKTIIKGGNDFKNFVFSEDGEQVAFVAERDSKAKDPQKFYKLWYYRAGDDTARRVADRYTPGIPLGSTISEFGNLGFSKNGKRLFFGTSHVTLPKDTTIIEIDMPKVDIWHYNDDYLQTVQNYPARLRAEQQQNFLAVYDLEKNRIQQLGNKKLPQVLITNEGDAAMFVGVTDYDKRIESQWRGNTLKDIYAIDVNTGDKKLVKENLYGQLYPSAGGKYIMWYDRKAKHYFVWDGNKIKNITEKIKVPLWDEEHDSPDEPGSYGVMRWEKDDQAVFIYDRYGIWRIDLAETKNPKLVLDGRQLKKVYRYIQVDPEERFIEPNKTLLFRTFNEDDKYAGLWEFKFDRKLNSMEGYTPVSLDTSFMFGQVQKARNGNEYIYTAESFIKSPDLYVGYAATETESSRTSHGYKSFILVNNKLSSINSQQANYLWGTAELFKWKAYNGKEATGIVYKPENFDPKKKYPMIVYFYEKLSDGLFDYKEPAPIRSAVNVPFFVSRGYVIFMPDIAYTTGHPGKNAYDYIVSGSRALAKTGWVDSTRMALQGHSWGGYQAAQVATMTKLFKAIWAGAPVANMTSAYGGIRWESGVSRQFQYEKTQSRIGGTLWEKLPLYLENSPLFHLDKVTAPMVIMHNDADGAVPWYQGIEMFTALRRLGKKVWMFNYNGQGHGLTQRQDMRDYQIRMQQFFDWILKGERPARWITDGVPAVNKGKDWGLD